LKKDTKKRKMVAIKGHKVNELYTGQKGKRGKGKEEREKQQLR